MPTAISDASPLIYLSAIGRFPLLEALYESVLIPPAVWTEVVEQGAGRPGCEEVQVARREGSIQVIPTKEHPEIERLRGLLETGEREALSLALQRPNHDLLIDEHAGRQTARRLELDVTGTVGVLLRAERRGWIPEIGSELERLRDEAGFWISDALYERILDAADE